MTALYLHEDVKELLSGKTLVVLGDSVERSVYKDLVCLLQENRYLSEQELRKKGEESFIGDELVYGGCKGEQKNSVDYRECRYFKNDDACCRYYFITICYGPYIEEVLQELSQEPTDIIVMNSCLWDVHRHGKAGVEKYEENLEKLVSALQRLIPDCLFIWVTTPPVHIKSKGGFLMQPGTDLVKINEVRYCNEIAREVFREANEIDSRFRIVDLDYVFRHFEHHRASDGVHWNARAHRRMSNMILEEVSKAFSKEVPRVLGGWDMQPYSTPYESWENRLAKNWGSAPFEYDISHPSNWDFMSGLDFPPVTHMTPPEGFPPFHNPHSGPPFGTPPLFEDPSGLLRNLPFYDLDDLGHARQQVEYQSENRKRKHQEDSESEVVPEKQYRFGFTNSHLPLKNKTNQNGELSPKFSIIEIDGKMKKLVQIDDDTVIHVIFTDKEKEEYLKDQAKKLEQERLIKEKKEQEVAWLKEQDRREVERLSSIESFETKKRKLDFNEEVSARISALATFFLERYFKSSVKANIFNIVPPLTVLAAQVILKSHFCKSSPSPAVHAVQNHNQREINYNLSQSSVTSAINHSATPLQRDIPRVKVDTKALLAMPSPFAKSKVNSNNTERKNIESSNEILSACKYNFNEHKVLKDSQMIVKNEGLKEADELAENEVLKESDTLPENGNETFLNVKTERFVPESGSIYAENSRSSLFENLPLKNEIENIPECPVSNVLITPNKVDTFITVLDNSETCSKLSETTLTVDNVVSSTLNSEVECSEVDISRSKKKKERNPNETKEERRLRKQLRRERREERKRLKEKNELSQSVGQETPVVETETMWELSLSENLISRQRSSTWGPNYMSSFSQSASFPYNQQTVNNQSIYYQTVQHSSHQQVTVDHDIYKQQLDQQQQRLAIAQRQAQQQALLLQQRQQQEAAYQKALGNSIVQSTVPQPQLYIDEYGQTYTLEEETFIMGPSGQIQSLNSSYIQQQMQGAQSPLINPSLLYLQQSSKFL